MERRARKRRFEKGVRILSRAMRPIGTGLRRMGNAASDAARAVASLSDSLAIADKALIAEGIDILTE